MAKKVDGKSTLLNITERVRHNNSSKWKEEKKDLQSRFRGNCWVVLKRLIADFRNHYGNLEREKRQEMPYVSKGILYTSPALIAYAEGKSMDNSTVNRWLTALQEDKKKMIDSKPFILDRKLISPTKIGLELNMDFFAFMDITPPSPLQPDKPPELTNGHIELSKLAHKFNRKHHSR